MTNKPTYNELLQHPKWQKKRLEVLKRDKFTCSECGDTETTLHVHHTSYISGKLPWEYHDIFYKTLCKDCHKTRHKQKEKIIIIDQVPGYCREVLPAIISLLSKYPCNNFFSRIIDKFVERSGK